MLKNYLLLALKVLRRKPFYTFISLFGISFTLMILMLLTSMFDAVLGANQPLSNVDRLVIMPMSERTRTETDTILKLDTIMMDDGTARYDSSYTYEDEIVSNSNGPMSYRFIKDNLEGLESAQKVAYYNDGSHIDGFLDGRKFTFTSYYTSASYWEITDYSFLHGGPFGQDDENDANKVVIMTDKSAKEYFGEVSGDLIGREVELGEQLFTVRGIVKRPLSDNPLVGGDIYMPATTIDPRALDSEEVYGGFGVVAMAASPEGRDAIKEEVDFIAENFEMPPDSYHDAIEIFRATANEAYAMAILRERDPVRALRFLFIPVVVLLLLFVALPLLNLINLNISRVFERKAEIGVRKAFGANSRDILYQFIFENLVLTVIGGTIGMVLALATIYYVNANDLLGVTRLASSPKVFIYFIIVILVFGLLSGLLPAYRMSKTNVANSLR